MKDIQGKTVIVTGASRGIGKAIARHFAQAGANLVLAARSATDLALVAEKLETQTLVQPTDVANPTDCESLVAAAVERFGSVDVLVNNAGIDAFVPIDQIQPADLARVVNVNLTGAMTLTQAAIGHLSESRGHILNVSSTSGKFGAGFGSVYAATKAGLVAFSRSLRAELHSRGVGVSVLCPGFTDAGGIYERIKHNIGRGTPTLMGKTTDDKVAKAAVKCVRRNKLELIVNSIPMRPICVLQEMMPRLGAWVVRKTSLRWLRRVATSTQQKDATHRRAA